MKYPLLASRVFGVPLALHPARAQVIAQALSSHIAGRPRAYEDGDSAVSMEGPVGGAGYDIVRGVAVIDVSGTLVHKSGFLDAACGMRGYSGIRRDFLEALDDPEAKAIVLSIDSGGGEVDGLADLAQLIYESRGIKPIEAILDSSAYSAAYWLASACDRIAVPMTGGSGSIGVISVHTEYSSALESAGVSVTVLQYGSKKAFGHEAIKLSDEARASFQADIDTLGKLFVDTVARNRGLKSSAVRATQAGTYLGAAGLEVGLVDAVMAPDAAFRDLLKRLK